MDPGGTEEGGRGGSQLLLQKPRLVPPSRPTWARFTGGQGMLREMPWKSHHLLGKAVEGKAHVRARFPKVLKHNLSV